MTTHVDHGRRVVAHGDLVFVLCECGRWEQAPPIEAGECDSLKPLRVCDLPLDFWRWSMSNPAAEVYGMPHGLTVIGGAHDGAQGFLDVSGALHLNRRIRQMLPAGTVLRHDAAKCAAIVRQAKRRVKQLASV